MQISNNVITFDKELPEYNTWLDTCHYDNGIFYLEDFIEYLLIYHPNKEIEKIKNIIYNYIYKTSKNGFYL